MGWRMEADEITKKKKKMMVFGIIWMTVKYGSYSAVSDLTPVPFPKVD